MKIVMNNTKSVIDSFPIHDNRVYSGKENNLRSSGGFVKNNVTSFT